MAQTEERWDRHWDPGAGSSTTYMRQGEGGKGHPEKAAEGTGGWRGAAEVVQHLQREA
ncbi:hypothetical protein BC834DRAFT_875617 [Gloeopeniophorella convolvens]|nr:hypothetical protein BC834DRAFT_875617 [Gloeopeniophorella convolvens]